VMAQTRNDRMAAIAREKRLDRLAGKEAQLWEKADALVTTKQPKNYDAAIKVIIDLRDLAARTHDATFWTRLESLKETHARKWSFIQSLQNKGM